MKEHKRKSSVGWVILTIILLGVIAMMGVALGSRSTAVDNSANLTACEANYQTEQEIAQTNATNPYNQSSGVYQALTDANNGIANCVKEFGSK